MTPMKTISQKIANSESERARLSAEIERCDGAVAAAHSHSVSLSQLRSQRATEAANAFVENRDPKTSDIDKEIALVEAKGSSAQEVGRAARDAAVLLHARLARVDAELSEARDALRKALIEDVSRRQLEEIEAFNTAVNSLEAPLARLSALGFAIASLRGRRYGSVTIADQIINCLMDKGLVIWRDNGNTWMPAWLPQIRFDAQKETTALETEFAALGLRS